MNDHTVVVDRTTEPSTLHYAPVFNVAGPFIDRHSGEGRAEKTAIRTSQGAKISYRQLADNVNRCGNVLLGLGLERGDRVLLIVKDCAEFFYGFWGAIKAGLVPVPVNTLLRAKDYAYILADSGCGALIYSPEYTLEVQEALSQLESSQPLAICVEGGEGSLQELLCRASAELEPVATTAEDRDRQDPALQAAQPITSVMDADDCRGMIQTPPACAKARSSMIAGSRRSSTVIE